MSNILVFEMSSAELELREIRSVFIPSLLRIAVLVLLSQDVFILIRNH